MSLSPEKNCRGIVKLSGRFAYSVGIAVVWKKGIKTTPVADRGWGLVTTLELPGGDKLGLYESKHLSPLT
jgi:hypothetical protein